MSNGHRTQVPENFPLYSGNVGKDCYFRNMFTGLSTTKLKNTSLMGLYRGRMFAHVESI